MTSITLGRSDVIVGVDTHKDKHVAVTIDGLGGRGNELVIAAANDGYAQLLAWADAQGHVVAFGVEATGSYDIDLARFLRRHNPQGN
jgi:transposase